MRCRIALVASSVMLLATSVAWAQDDEEGSSDEAGMEGGAEAGAEADTSASADVSASSDVGMGLPPPAPANAGADAAATDSDHDQMVGRFGVGYLGKQNVIIGVGATQRTIAAPVVGMRYWLDEFMGIDAGLGFNLSSGSVDAGGNADLDSNTVFVLHGGVPLSLASSSHFSFQIVPELNIGFGSGSAEPASGTGAVVSTDLSGFLLELGARAGGEVQFGFIGIPELALQAGVGLQLAISSHGSDDGTNDVSQSNTVLGTTVNDNPWNIFTSNIAALYYF